MSDFHCDTSGVEVDTFFRLTCSVMLLGGKNKFVICKQITLACSQCLSHAGPAPVHRAHSSGSMLLCQKQSEAGPGLHAPPRSKPLRFRHSGSPQRCRISWACVLCLCPSQVQVAQVFGEHGHCDLSPLLSLMLSFLGVQLVHLLRQMMTSQNPKKS